MGKITINQWIWRYKIGQDKREAIRAKTAMYISLYGGFGLAVPQFADQSHASFRGDQHITFGGHTPETWDGMNIWVRQLKSDQAGDQFLFETS
jgi:hypothetical protein